MMNTNKTKREILSEMLCNESILANNEWVNFLNNEIELLNRKKERGNHNKNEAENNLIIQDVLEWFEKEPSKRTCSEILAKMSETYKNLSLPRISAIMTKICGNVCLPKEDSPIVRIKEGKNVFFINRF